MPKSSKKQIYQDEIKIIRELQKNSKESIDKIAKKCGVSRQKVWRIIKRLENNKTIWGYHAVVDEEKLNLKRFFILLKRTSKPASLKSVDLVLKRELKKSATKIGVTVEDSFFLNGSYDWLLSLTAGDIKQVKQFNNLFNNLFKEGFVSDIQVMEVIFTVENSGINNPNLEKFKDFFSL